MFATEAHQYKLRSRLSAPQDIQEILTTELTSQFEQLNIAHTYELPQLQQLIQNLDAQLAANFWKGSDITQLVQSRAWAVEQLLLLIWQQQVADPNISLIAAGGFGRGELHPHSDIDLLILLPETYESTQTEQIENFVRILWDAGFYPGHSVRSVAQCSEDSRQDVQFVTNLLEARLLDGNQDLFEQLKSAIHPEHIWPADTFFAAKMAEQQARHEKYFDTAFNLEPNIKEGPGGLRDLQMVKWVTQRHFNTLTLQSLLEHKFLEPLEFQRLLDCRNFIWRVRYALHLLAGRSEDRLIFEHQRLIAEKFGYHDQADNLAVEQFMQTYYRNALRVERMNERLLQLFREELILDREEGTVLALDERFQTRQGYLEIRQQDVFIKKPSSLLELFLALQQHPEIDGIRATTIRAIRNHLYLIDDKFRADPHNYKIFMQLLSQQLGIYTQFKRMNRYGVLESFIPAFKKITGRMQYDLFHVYTVDQHTLFVIRNLRRFAYGHYRHRFPHGQAVYQRIPKPEFLYLAAFFHDIAKGRDGDHSTLGAKDADTFCRLAGLPDDIRELVTWLVHNHLLMSMTAQSRDISDENVLSEFCLKVPTRKKLDALYLLTMADIAATSPKLWNGWKDSLLWQLYRATVYRLKNEQHVPGRLEFLTDVQSKLPDEIAGAERITKFWESIPDEHLQKLSIDQLLWTSKELWADTTDKPVVSIRAMADKGYSEVMIYSQDYQGLFASVIQIFDQMRLNILNARVITTSSDFACDLFQISNNQNESLSDRDASRLTAYLITSLKTRRWKAQQKQKQPGKFRYFDDQPEVYFEELKDQEFTRLELACLDQPGLLAQLSALFTEQDLILEDARIATFGHRVEDAFMLRNVDNQPLTKQQQVTLKKAITQLLAEWE